MHFNWLDSLQFIQNFRNLFVFFWQSSLYVSFIWHQIKVSASSLWPLIHHWTSLSSNSPHVKIVSIQPTLTSFFSVCVLVLAFIPFYIAFFHNSATNIDSYFDPFIFLSFYCKFSIFKAYYFEFSILMFFYAPQVFFPFLTLSFIL